MLLDFSIILNSQLIGFRVRVRIHVCVRVRVGVRECVRVGVNDLHLRF